MVWEYAVLELAICEVDNPLDLDSNERNIKKIQNLERSIKELSKKPGFESRVQNMEREKTAIERIMPFLPERWVLRTYPKMKPVLHYNAAKKEFTIVKDCLYTSRSSHQVVQLAANDGWEMTRGLPVSRRRHFDTGADLGGYNIVSMMRRKVG